MEVRSYQSVLDDYHISDDKDYIAYLISFNHYDISHEKVFTYFQEYKGKRFWFKSKSTSEDIVGVDYIATIKQDKMNPIKLERKKNDLFQSILCIALNETFNSRLRLFGGMKFDDKETTDEWKSFKHIGFYLSRFLFDFNSKEMFYIVKKDEVQFENDINEIHHTLKAIESVTLETHDIPKRTMMRDLYSSNWKKLVAETVDNLDDDFLKVVLSRQRLLLYDHEIHPNYLIHRLLESSKTYTVYFERKGSTFISRTPEKLFDIHGNELSTDAIAGSIERTTDESINNRNKAFLLNDQKNLVEHEYVKESIINELDPISKQVTFKERPKILENRFIYHLYTPISSILNDDTSVFDVMSRLHPTPAVGGLPREQASDYIKAHEMGTRGLYAAPLGVIYENNDSEFCVAIRSMLINKESVTLFAGCGIVKDSEVESEYNETAIKFKPMLHILGVEGY